MRPALGVKTDRAMGRW